MLRTHTCGELRAGHTGQEVVICGWVDAVRDHGGVQFVNLRDRHGLLQVTPHRDHVGELEPRVEKLRAEYCLRVRGTVQRRPEGMTNPDMPTGEVELAATAIEVLSEAPPLPYDLSGLTGEASDELRFRYRYLDMRRPAVQERFLFRSRMLHEVRAFLHEEGFVDLETPVLTKSTPEGARDFLVPSRIQPGSFYALPQSPQIFKQLFMVAGMDRYMQIVRCFRDEDLRAERQPEFTQLDLEMSFVDEDDVMDLVERLTRRVVERTLGVTLEEPFPRLTHAEAMARTGCDAPDLRFGLELIDFTDLAGSLEFRVFAGAVEAGGLVKGIRVPGGGELSRKDITTLEGQLRDFGAKGLAWVRPGADEWVGPVARFLPAPVQAAWRERAGAADGDLLLFVADPDARVVHASLAELRRLLARRLDLLRPGELRFCWVTSFPLFEWDEEERRHVACHHPFTAPVPEDLALLESDPTRVRARAYDLVLNGIELGGGSIRIHQRDLQQRVFQAIGLAPAEAEEKFQFLLEALRFGAPPHGGIALGVDRWAMLLLGLASIREVIAFPKSQKGVCFLTQAPTPVAADQLRQLGIAALPAEPDGVDPGT